MDANKSLDEILELTKYEVFTDSLKALKQQDSLKRTH